MRPSLGSILIGAAVLLGGLGAFAWYAGSTTVEVLTDDATIDLATDDAKPRDILWQPPEQLEPESLPQGAQGGSFSADGSRFAFSAPGPDGDLDLYESLLASGQWSTPRRLLIASSQDHDISPAYAPTGALWFASDRAGGQGGYDLWIAPSTDAGWASAKLAASVYSQLGSSAIDELSPAISPDGSLLCFVEQADRNSPSSLALFDLRTGKRIAAAETPPEDDAAPVSNRSPAFSPSGDFLYFASDRPGGEGGFDLYRARMTAGTPGPAWWLGKEVNTASDELDPALDLAGFRLRFRRADDAGAPTTAAYQQTTAREVYKTVRTRWASLAVLADLLRILPWLLLALALVLLFAGLQRSVRSGDWQQRFSTLGLMARCVLASIAIHALLAVLLGLWDIHAGVPGETGTEQTRVALTTNRSAAAAASQLQASAASAKQPVTDTARELPALTAQPSTEHRTQAPAARAAPAPSRMTAATPSTTVNAAPTPAASSAEVAIERSSMPTRARSATSEQRSTDSRLTDTSRPTAAPSPTGATAAAIETTTPSATAPAARQAVADARTPPSVQPVAVVAAPAPAALDLPQSTPGALPTAERSASAESGSRDTPIPTAAPLSGRPDAPTPSASQAFATQAPDSPATRAAQAPSIQPSVSPSGAPAQPIAAAVPLPTLDLGELAAPAMPTGERLAEHEQGNAQSSRASVDEPATRAVVSVQPGESQRIETVAQAVTPQQTPAMKMTDAPAAPSITMPSIAPPQPLAALAVPTFATPVMPVARVISGLVLDARTDQPIAEATVLLDGDDRQIRETTTSDDGRFAITPDQLPEFAALTASAEGYLSESVNIAEADVGDDGASVTFRLNPRSRSIIALEDDPQVRHLGNDEFSGRINSQFQVDSEGLTYERTFVLAPDQLPPVINMAAIRMMARGVQNPNLIFINGRELPTRLDESPGDGSFGEFIARVPADWLREGENTILIRAVKRANTDIDDFEFVNPQLYLRRAQRSERAQ